MKIAIRFSKSAEPDGNTHCPFNNHVIKYVLASRHVIMTLPISVFLPAC